MSRLEPVIDWLHVLLNMLVEADTQRRGAAKPLCTAHRQRYVSQKTS